MALELNEITEALKTQTKKSEIAKAIQHENRLRFHVESFMQGSEISQPLTVFLDWVKTLIPKDKYRIFVSLFQFPTPNIQLTSNIFKELERVFDGKNPSKTYQFTDPKFNDDWEDYLRENEVYKTWRSKGWECVKTCINSVLIVDLPQEQTSERPEPYFYFLPISEVLDYGYSKGVIEYIIFKQGEDKVAVFDDKSYRVLRLNDKREIQEVVVDTAHDLGYCPATFFWSDSISQTMPSVKESPLSAQLGNLDWLLFFSISKKHLDLYAPYPIYSGYEADCDFENNETGDVCDGGYLRDDNDNYKVRRDGSVEQCPVCAEKRLAGVGSYIEVPVPGRDEVDLRDPITITTIDRASLDYNVQECDRLEDKIYGSVVGKGGDVQQKQSVNERQVNANFESKTSVLNYLKENIQKAMKFANDTMCRLRYADRFIGSSISMGTEFYIYSVSDLHALYKQAKENGASEAELDVINQQIIATEHRNNPVAMQRMLILKHLEPYRHYSFKELMDLNKSNLLNPELLQVKINFNTFVNKFERENTNVIEFGSQLDFDKKITIIFEKLLEYGREYTGAKPTGADGGTEGSSGEGETS